LVFSVVINLMSFFIRDLANPSMFDATIG